VYAYIKITQPRLTNVLKYNSKLGTAQNKIVYSQAKPRTMLPPESPLPIKFGGAFSWSAKCDKSLFISKQECSELFPIIKYL
jgi:hypothetical protein